MTNSGSIEYRRLILACVLVLLVPYLTGCVDDKMRISGCEQVGDIRPICGMKAPEDIAALPDGRYLLLSNFGGMHDLSLIHI